MSAEPKSPKPKPKTNHKQGHKKTTPKQAPKKQQQTEELKEWQPIISAQAKKSIKDDISLKGKASLINKVLRFVLFPIFHPYITLLVLFLMWIIPTFIGAKPTNVHTWYANKISSLWQKNIKTNPVVKQVSNIELPKQIFAGVKKIEVNHQSTNAINNRRQMFLKAKEINTPKEPIIVKETIKPQSQEIKLIYLQKPQTIQGKADILNANQLIIDNKIIFLYGIYANPKSNKGIQAREFLINTTKNKDINCQVVAYTNQQIATAYCFVDDININYLMVEKNFSEDVLLGK